MNFLEGWGPALAKGTAVTLEVAVLSAVIGSVIGSIAASASLSRTRVLRVLANYYSTVIRGIPQLLLILFVYFGSTVALSRVLAFFDPSIGTVNIPPLPAGVFALSLIVGGYATEVFRGAFLAVPHGQIEAGTAVGMSRPQIFCIIKFPQMLRFALPGLGNIWISTLKDTSLISIIGMEELMRVSVLATADTRRALFFYVTAGAIYLVMTMFSAVALHKLEKRAARGERMA